MNHTPSTTNHSFQDKLNPSHFKVITTAAGGTTGLFLLMALMIKTDPILIPPIVTAPSYIDTTPIPTLMELPTPTKTPAVNPLPDPPALAPRTPPEIKPINIDIRTTHLSDQNWTTPDLGHLLPAQQGNIIDTSMLDSIPRIILQIAPRIQKKQSEGKKITVEFSVDIRGNVTSVKIVSSDSPHLNTPTKQALMRWKFEPGMRNGEAVPFRLIQSISFN